MQIGTANYSNGRAQIETIKPGDNLYRILPPLGSMAKKGQWNRYMKIEWGYKDSKGKNRPFQDVRKVDFKTKMVEVESAAHLKRENLKTKLDQARAMLKNGQITEEQLQQVSKLVMQFNLEKKYYVNAINTKGDIVLLKVGYKAMESLLIEIQTLKTGGVDPLSVNNGRFFNFQRSGEGLGTLYTVKVHKEQLTIEGIGKVERDIVHVLTEEIISRLGTEATDLGDLDKKFPIVTSEQVEEMVNGGPAAVDMILGTVDSESVEDQLEETMAVKPNLKEQKIATSEFSIPMEILTQPSTSVPAQQAVAAVVSVINTTDTVSDAAKQKNDFMASLGL